MDCHEVFTCSSKQRFRCLSSTSSPAGDMIMDVNSKRIGSIALLAAGAAVIAVVLVATGSPLQIAIIVGVGFFVLAIGAIVVRSRTRRR